MNKHKVIRYRNSDTKIGPRLKYLIMQLRSLLSVKITIKSDALSTGMSIKRTTKVYTVPVLLNKIADCRITCNI